MSAEFPREVKVVEVGPRDGLQNEGQFVPTNTKIAFINRLTEAGLSHIEVTSFVSPRWVPQLADSSDVFDGIERKAGVVYSALVPNMLGLQRAIESKVKHVAVFTAASEIFNQRNTNASIAESIQRFKPLCKVASDEGVTLRGYVSTSFGCPYDGPVDPAKVVEVAQMLVDIGVAEVSLGDTNGVAVPNQVHDLLGDVLKRIPKDQIAVHFHDTHSRALANVSAALQMGIHTVDASAGGLGGCPYSKGATGNLATEDLVAMLHGMGIETGVDLEKLMEASLFVEAELGRELPSRHLKAVRCAKPNP
jgi:hydroxymethylglutaryl-CoA lyase